MIAIYNEETESYTIFADQISAIKDVAILRGNCSNKVFAKRMCTTFHVPYFYIIPRE